MFTPIFVFNPFAQGSTSILRTFIGRHGKAIHQLFSRYIMQFTEDDDDSDYEDPSPEEVLDWIYPDPDSRPEEDQYGE